MNETAIVGLSITVLVLAIVLVIVVFKLISTVQEPARIAEVTQKIKEVTASAKAAVERNKQ
jgi:hypothetical protein